MAFLTAMVRSVESCERENVIVSLSLGWAHFFSRIITYSELIIKKIKKLTHLIIWPVTVLLSHITRNTIALPKLLVVFSRRRRDGTRNSHITNHILPFRIASAIVHSVTFWKIVQDLLVYRRSLRDTHCEG
jgi:hypothetical protein